MFDQPTLTEREWSLIIELLHHERDELPSEIHHCQVVAYREGLHRRLEMVENLLNKIRVPATAM